MDEGGSGEDSALAIGYGCVIGRAETKAIAMSVLDRCLEHGDKRFPTEDEEFVLYHVDGVEATGFISHLKLPHYVTFQSKLSSVRGTRGDGPLTTTDPPTRPPSRHWKRRRRPMQQRYNYAFFDEASKREIRRAIVKGVSIPGYQVPFASREMPIGRGWGTGGLQITLAIIGRDDTLKVIDQGSDDSVNAVNIKKLVADTTDVEVTDDTESATLIQSRHRIPEHPLRRRPDPRAAGCPRPSRCAASSPARPPRACMPRPTTRARGWSCSTKSCASTPLPPAPTIRARERALRHGPLSHPALR